MAKDDGYDELLKKLSDTLARAKDFGVFDGSRELVKCENCGLIEDVDVYGRLHTYIEGGLRDDSGLRFGKITDEVFECPKCGGKVSVPSPPDFL